MTTSASNATKTSHSHLSPRLLRGGGVCSLSAFFAACCARKPAVDGGGGGKSRTVFNSLNVLRKSGSALSFSVNDRCRGSVPHGGGGATEITAPDHDERNQTHDCPQ